MECIKDTVKFSPYLALIAIFSRLFARCANHMTESITFDAHTKTSGALRKCVICHFSLKLRMLLSHSGINYNRFATKTHSKVEQMNDLSIHLKTNVYNS